MVELDLKWVLVGVLATWRVTHLLHAELGPWRLLDRLRHAVSRRMGTHLFDCFYCLSLWVAVPFGLVLGVHWLERVLAVLAFSAGAILLERATHPGFDAARPAVPEFYEGKEADHELLSSTDARSHPTDFNSR